MAQAIDNEALHQKLVIAEKNVEFLQHEHAKLLTDLHQEVDYLKEKCRKLQFSLEVANISSLDEDRYVTRINALESEVVHWCQECQRLKDHLKYADDVVSNLENVLAKQYQQFETEINSRDDKISALETEMAQKSRTIAYLMAELRQHRNIEKADILCKSSSSHPSLKSPCSSHSEPESNPHNNLSSRIQSSLEKDKKARTMAILDGKLNSALNSKDSRHSSVTRLPPIKIPHRITPSTPSIKRSGSKPKSYIRQQLRLTDSEIETLAIDQSIKPDTAVQSFDQF